MRAECGVTGVAWGQPQVADMSEFANEMTNWVLGWNQRLNTGSTEHEGCMEANGPRVQGWSAIKRRL